MFIMIYFIIGHGAKCWSTIKDRSFILFMGIRYYWSTIKDRSFIVSWGNGSTGLLLKEVVY